MTELEHAIKHIKTRADAWAVKEVTEALQSISKRLDKALSQEPCRVKNELNVELNELKPCTDAVSREAVLNAICDYVAFEEYEDKSHTFTIRPLTKRIKQLPSVTQKSGKWILVKKGLPEDKTHVLTTIKVPNRIAHARSSWYEGGFFHNDNGDTWRATDREVIAWMPLPEPYEPQESEEQTE